MRKGGQTNSKTVSVVTTESAKPPRNFTPTDDWSPGVFDRLQRIDVKQRELVDGMLQAIRRNRRSKPPVQW